MLMDVPFFFFFKRSNHDLVSAILAKCRTLTSSVSVIWKSLEDLKCHLSLKNLRATNKAEIDNPAGEA